jgi:hypothetical protein
MKTASRIVLTFCILVFFASVSFSQVASSPNPAKTSTKSAVAAPVKATDGATASTCGNHNAKGSCAPGKNFVDKNGDGKCDNCGGTGKCKEGGSCAGKGMDCAKGCGKGHGAGNCCASKGKDAPSTQPNK